MTMNVIEEREARKRAGILRYNDSHYPEEYGFKNLAIAVEGYNAALEEPIETDEEIPPELSAEEAKSLFIGQCLTDNEVEVLQMTKSDPEELTTSQQRTWSRLRNSIFVHPAIVSHIAKIEKEKIPKEELEQTGTIFERTSEPDWKVEAACAGDARFVNNRRLSNKDKAELRETCADCPVYAQCFEYTGERKPEKGIWAGLSRSSGSQSVNPYHEDGTPRSMFDAE